MAKLVNLMVRQGETFRWSFIWAREDPASTTETPLPPIPLDLEGAVARMQMREKYGTAVLLELTTANGGLVIGPEAGRISMVMTPAQTDVLGVIADNALKARARCKYDLEVEFPNEDVRRVLQGEISISANITRQVSA